MESFQGVIECIFVKTNFNIKEQHELNRQSSPLLGMVLSPLFQHLTAYLMPPLLPPSGQRWEEETVFRVILSDGTLVKRGGVC